MRCPCLNKQASFLPAFFQVTQHKQISRHPLHLLGKLTSFFKEDKDGKIDHFFNNIMFCQQTLNLVFEETTFFNKNVLNNRLLIFSLQLFYCLFFGYSSMWRIGSFQIFTHSKEKYFYPPASEASREVACVPHQKNGEMGLFRHCF